LLKAQISVEIRAALLLDGPILTPLNQQDCLSSGFESLSPMPSITAGVFFGVARFLFAIALGLILFVRGHN